MSELAESIPLAERPLSVLLLEDSAFDAELLQESLLHSYPHANLQWVRDAESFSEALERGGFDLILSDHDLGGYSGTDALRLAHQRVPMIPFIFVSGVIGEDNAVELLKQGATDYVSKGRLSRLASVLERALREVAERSARIAAETELRDAKEKAEQLTIELAERVREIETGQARLRAATDAGGLGVWQLDLTAQELIASNHCKSNFGRDESLPFTYEDLQNAVHPDDLVRMREAVAQTIATGKDYRIEYRILRPDGQLAWVRILGRLEYDAAGRPSYIAGISQEITHAMLGRRRAELLELLDREVYGPTREPGDIAYHAAEALGRALDVSRAGYGLLDRNTQTITIERDWNAPGISTLAGTLNCRDFGSYTENLQRGDALVLADVRTDPRTRDHADAFIAIHAQSLINVPVGEDRNQVAMLYLHHAAPRHWTAEELNLVREVAHRTWHAVERRRAEQNLHALANSLEQQVQERTTALMKSEAALRQSQKMEAVGQLTGGLAHDFNNLLGAISGSLELLKRRFGEDSGAMRYVTVGQTATKRAAALTHRLLAFSRQQTLEPKVVKVNQLISGFEDLVRRTIGPHVMLEVKCGIDVWPIHADPSQLENALLNLCINARDAMSDGGKLVVETANRTLDERAAGEEQMSPGQYVCISVSDNGTGMTADVVARAFDPFFTTKPIGVGTGLGLSMVYGFARQSGGQARIHSEMGVGTTIRMFLPRYAGKDILAEDALDRAPAISTVGLGETILVVDDEASVRMFMVEMLQELGYHVLEAEAGSSAIQVLQNNASIALLVTDVGLPGGMNGRQLADAARKIHPSMRVLFVTGYAENAVLSHGQLPSGMQVLTKPFQLEVFGLKIQSLMNSTTNVHADPAF
ncbi:response regulator [Acidovorax sp. SUPP2522]|uniref:response regulator n=1 Tax=unclassified Acidovorax TaxID=2684926 RepID=UPI00234BEB71|nr:MULTISPECIES: response regulator [unclassified Acidovorax]WCM99811.1 response regulator [Acidovorax sp. GBBC 1281]GKT19973.1 response regulator [Acidovorax sp. SUPP2522]